MSPPSATSDDPHEAELREWLRGVAAQQEGALGALYGALCNRVFRHALRLVRDVATAEEIVEDVFWQVWRQAPRFDPARGCVLAWMSAITRERALELLRSRGRNPLYEALDLQLGAAADAGARAAACVQDALAALQPLHRQMVTLAFESGYTPLDIADQMGLPLGTVRSQLRHGLAAMKSSLEAVLLPPVPKAKTGPA